MSADVVNLRLARKRRVRAEADDIAAANRAAHGIPAALRRKGESEEHRRLAVLEAHRLTGAPTGE